VLNAGLLYVLAVGWLTAAAIAAMDEVSLTLPGNPTSPLVAEEKVQPVLLAFQERLPLIGEQIPAIVESAQDFAEHVMAQPDSLLNVPYWEQTAFSEELLNRAGGLSHAYPTEAPGRSERATDHDVVLLSVRSWEKNGEAVLNKIQECRAKGWKVTLIASASGRPDDLNVDHFIDNGAPSGTAEHGRVNVLANVAIGWMWCCEYASAMTRKGKIPGILVSVSYDDAEGHNRPIQRMDGRHWIGECDTPVPAGELARIYLERVEKLVTDLKSEHIQGQIDRAADVVARRLAAGGTVGLTGLGHLILHEPMEDDVKSPFKTFMVVHGRNAFAKNLEPGDLVVYLAYMGLNSAYKDYGKLVEEAGLDMISSYAPPPPDYQSEQPALRGIHERPKNVLAHIDQPWLLGDAEVPLPCEPRRMAPVSGICRTLIFRMLDDEVAARLQEAAVPALDERATGAR